MSIQSIFPTNIYINDFDLDDSFTQNLKLFSKHILSLRLARGEDYKDLTNDSTALFTEANMTECSELRQLRDMFINGFYELANSFPGNDLTIEDFQIPELWSKTDKLAFMNRGDYKSVHSHSQSYAYGIFYLEDVDNEKNGGELILHDPKFASQTRFNGKKTLNFETKKNRMIIAPNYVWHEVSQYAGTDERYAIVLNCDMSLDFYKDHSPSA